MVDTVMKLMDSLPLLHARKNSGLAAVIGFFFGAIGLAVYFRSFIDFVFPVAVLIALLWAFGDPGWLAGGIFASIYGYFRAEASNAKVGVEGAGLSVRPSQPPRPALGTAERSDDV